LTNKFVSVLKAIGQDALKVVGAIETPAAQEALSLVEDVVPGAKPVVDLVTKVGSLIQGAEATAAVLTNGASGTGAQKLSAIVPLVGNEILQSELMIGKVVNQTLFNKGVADLTTAIVEIYNSQAPATPAASSTAAAPAATAAPAPAAAPAAEPIPAT